MITGINKGASSSDYGMGTVISHIVNGGHAKEAIRAARVETKRLEALLSRFIPESDIGRINSRAGTEYERVSGETYAVLLKAKEFSKICRGAFDVTIGPLVELWRRAGEDGQPPQKSAIRRNLRLVSYTDLDLKPAEKEVCLKKRGQFIDLGGIGKGYAADRVLDKMREYGVTSAFTNFGGNVAAIDAKPDGSPWRIGIKHPRKENSLIGAVSIVNRSVVTSGDYQRYFIGRDGKRYHHILDPNTGCPSESGLVSVTVVAESSMTADALSTMLFVAGKEKGLILLKSFPGTDAVLIDTGLNITITPGLKGCFEAGEGIKQNLN